MGPIQMSTLPTTPSSPLAAVRYYLSEHPSIVTFRWSATHSYGATWYFLFTSISFYLLSATLLHLILPRRRRLPLGPLPAFHSLTISLLSATIFAGTIISTASEIRSARWLWRGRSQTTPFQWLLCFPIGTRPSGRVFFWSYIYYLSRFLHALRAYMTIVQHRKLPLFNMFNNSILIFMSFLWLEFSQSFQVLGVLLTNLGYAVVYGYRFWTAIGLPGACFPFVVSCQVVLLGCNLLCHVGVLLLHSVKRGGCNGIGAWGFNSVLNGAILIMILNFFVKMHVRKTVVVDGGGGGGGGGFVVEKVDTVVVMKETEKKNI